jgi:hypothetical protein
MSKNEWIYDGATFASEYSSVAIDKYKCPHCGACHTVRHLYPPICPICFTCRKPIDIPEKSYSFYDRG